MLLSKLNKKKNSKLIMEQRNLNQNLIKKIAIFRLMKIRLMDFKDFYYNKKILLLISFKRLNFWSIIMYDIIEKTSKNFVVLNMI